MRLPKTNLNLKLNWFFIFYFILVSILRLKIDWGLPLFWIGGAIGSYLLELDHFLYVFWIYPYELTSMRIKRLFDQRRFKEAFEMLVETKEERSKLSFHSVIFQAVLPLFAFFVLTSTGSMLGAGLVMGLYLSTLDEQFKNFRKEKNINSWFWQIKTQVPQRIQVLYFVGMLILFILLSLLLI